MHREIDGPPTIPAVSTSCSRSAGPHDEREVDAAAVALRLRLRRVAHCVQCVTDGGERGQGIK